MNAEEALLQRWFARVMDSYSRESAHFYTAELDRFRNPVGSCIRENLSFLLEELLGDMNSFRIQGAVSNIIGIMAVQDLTMAQAAGFFLHLKPMIADMPTKREFAAINQRVDELSILAYEEYARCRERLTTIRINERQRAMAVPSAMALARL